MLSPICESLDVVLSKKIFKIPTYQRHYSWQTKQRKDLFADIKNSMPTQEGDFGKNHFMATVVCLKTKDKITIGGTTNFDFYDIVDGQQRLTTLIILLKAIGERLGGSAATDLNKLLFKSDDKNHFPILQTNHDEKSILSHYLEKGECLVIDKEKRNHADNNLLMAIEECTNFVNLEIVDAMKLLCFVQNNLYFIFLPMEDEGAVYTVFEVLNSRGLDVDWLDKCKSLLMGLLYEKIQSVNYEKPDDAEVSLKTHLGILHQHWANIYKTIGIRKIKGHEVVKFSATLKNIHSTSRKVMNEEDAIDFFKKDCISVQKIIETTKHIEEVVLCLSKLYDDKKLKAVTDVSQARLLAVSIILKHNNENDKKDRKKLLDQWERTSFKIYTLFGKDSRSEVGDYIDVARKIQKGDAGIKELISDIANIGKKDGIDLFDINKIDDEFKNKDWYNDGWKEELRYFFFKYEEYLSKSKKPNQEEWHGTKGIWNSTVDETIEHILPQKENADGWNHFTTEEHKKYLNSIGNLCILPRDENLNAGYKPFSKKDNKECKKDIYLNNLSIVSLREIYYANVKDKEERVVWDKDAIEERTERLLKFAKEQWKDLDVY